MTRVRGELIGPRTHTLNGVARVLPPTAWETRQERVAIWGAGGLDDRGQRHRDVRRPLDAEIDDLGADQLDPVDALVAGSAGALQLESVSPEQRE